MDRNTEDVVYLVRCALNETVPENIERIDTDGVYRVAERHRLSAAVAFALQSAGATDARTTTTVARNERKTVILENEKNMLLRRLEDAGIWYMPLKGAVIRGYYPKFGMREMVDYDILYDVSRSGDVKATMEDLGFTVEKYDTTSNHDVYHKKPLTSFEMHRSLFGVFHEDRLSAYYADVKSRLIKDEGNNFGHHFSDEDFYVYLVAHEYKHFRGGGTGLRSLADTYVCLRHFEALDWAYIRSETDKLGITDFEARNRALALSLFGDCPAGDEAMLEYILGSGAFGTVRNFVGNGVERTKGRRAYIRRRLFLPMDKVEKAYPFFCRHRLLLPLLPVYRLYLKRKSGRSAAFAELKALGKARGEDGRP